MGLYLCVFDGDEEFDGVDVGSYADFNALRHAVTERLEDGIPGTKFPQLVLHSDCDGGWTCEQCCDLEKEVRAIAAAFQRLAPLTIISGWQKEVANLLALNPANLSESFIDVDGEPVLERLLSLCQTAQERSQPILFQ